MKCVDDCFVSGGGDLISPLEQMSEVLQKKAPSGLCSYTHVWLPEDTGNGRVAIHMTAAERCVLVTKGNEAPLQPDSALNELQKR